MVCRSLQEVHNISKQSREVVVVLILVILYCCIIAWLAALDRNQHALGVDVMICIRSGSVFTNSDLPILFYNLCMHKFTLQKVAIKAHQILTHKSSSCYCSTFFGLLTVKERSASGVDSPVIYQ